MLSGPMDVLRAIGNTSIVRLRRVVPPRCADSVLYGAHCTRIAGEALNPGSDRQNVLAGSR